MPLSLSFLLACHCATVNAISSESTRETRFSTPIPGDSVRAVGPYEKIPSAEQKTSLSADREPIGVALPGEPALSRATSSAKLKDRVRLSDRSRRPLSPNGICKLTPVKIFFFRRVTRVPRRTRPKAAAPGAGPTRHFARGQTSRRGLPGNCWKHLASVYSVIEARSHLATRAL